MKYIATTFLTLALFYTIPYIEYNEIKTPVAATCYGYTPCNACSNCSQCKYCKAGGTCGVCKKNNDGNIYKQKAPVSTQCKAITKKEQDVKEVQIVMDIAGSTKKDKKVKSKNLKV